MSISIDLSTLPKRIAIHSYSYSTYLTYHPNSFIYHDRSLLLQSQDLRVGQEKKPCIGFT